MRFAHLAERFSRNVEVSDDTNKCWLWKGARNNNGYGVFNLGPSFGYKLALAHRVTFELENGQIAHGAHVLHACDNRLCCNPRHLSTGDQSENMRQMVQRKRSATGERNAFSKLDDQAVKAIRSDPRSTTTLASVYNVAHQTISKARSRKTWRHVA